jgi:hypothetical protein
MVNYFKEPGIIETFFCKMIFLITVCFRMKENTKDILLDFILNFLKLSPMINEARMTMLDTMGEEQIFLFSLAFVNVYFNLSCQTLPSLEFQPFSFALF